MTSLFTLKLKFKLQTTNWYFYRIPSLNSRPKQYMKLSKFYVIHCFKIIFNLIGLGS
jgi:hypothetical protein